MATEILRPTAQGDECNIHTQYGCSACPNHYDCVYEAVADGYSTTARTEEADWERDLYNIADSGVGAGTINKITVYVIALAGRSPIQTSLKIAIKTGGVPYEGSEETVTLDTWVEFTKEWAQNPGNAHAWTWEEINALQIGMTIRKVGAIDGMTMVTQVYVVVDYTPAGWTGKISGVTNPAKIMGVLVANIKSVKGVE